MLLELNMQHTPPSTYILRELIDIPVAEPVSWWPGFEYLPTGWWYLIIILSVITIVLMSIALRNVWKNRYRREAIAALTIMMKPYQKTVLCPTQKADQQVAIQLFYLLKQVLMHIEPKTAKLADNVILIHLDTLMVHKNKHFQWQGKIGQRWIASLYNPNIQLSQAEVETLNKQSKQWLKLHKNQFSICTSSFFKG